MPTDTLPVQQENISELAPTMKTRTPRRKLDPLGRKFAKGFRTTTQIAGNPPIMRRARR